jgi:hypothetical protein
MVGRRSVRKFTRQSVERAVTTRVLDAAAQARAHAKGEEIAQVPALAHSVPGGNDDETHENYAAVACALQDMQPSAFEEGLVCGWSNTVGFARDPALKTWLGAEAAWELVGALYFGYPAPCSTSTREPGAADFTRWVRD